MTVTTMMMTTPMTSSMMMVVMVTSDSILNSFHNRLSMMVMTMMMMMMMLMVMTMMMMVMMMMVMTMMFSPLQGSVTDVQIWDRFSDLTRLQAWADCSQEEGRAGNVLDWETAEIRVKDLVEEEVDRAAVCDQERPRYLAFGTKRNFLEAQHFCTTLSGDIAVAESPLSATRIKEALQEIDEKQASSNPSELV